MGPSAKFVLSCFLLAASMGGVGASHFLGKAPRKDAGMTASAELRLLDELEKELGSEHRTFTNMRLQRIKTSLQPLFQAMPKNTAGRLDLPAVNYVLRRTLLDRHAWFVKGLEPESKSWAAFEDSDPMFILKDHVSENGTDIFESRFKGGLDMNEVAVLVASLEHLVHKESFDRLSKAYSVRNLTMEDSLSQEEVTEVLDVYMSLYIMGQMIPSVSNLKVETARKVRDQIEAVYPTFPDTQKFTRDVQQSVMPNRDYFYLAEVMSVVDEIQDRYGRWQNSECLSLKKSLMDMEDRSVGGAGRVRLADFYDAALNKGKWEFVESAEYLRTMGALDDTDRTDLKLIIPNYVNGPTNCAAATSYYQVCCIDECDGLLGHLEKAFAAPEATPEQILAAVRALPSSSESAPRTLAPWLQRRLHDVAKHHGGTVPLHGRLFSQWMHYAYPRECTYPHRVGETKMHNLIDYKQETNKEPEATQEEMRAFISVQKPGVFKNHASGSDLESDDAMQSPMWSMEEELILARQATAVGPVKGFSAQTFLRCTMLLLLLGSFFKMAPLQLVPVAGDGFKKEKASDKFFA